MDNLNNAKEYQATMPEIKESDDVLASFVNDYLAQLFSNDQRIREICGEQLGSIKPWLANAAPPGWLALDTGAEVGRATYPQLWAWVQEFAPLITEAEWQAQAAVQSSVGAYSSGNGNTTFRLPRIVDYLRGGLATDVGIWQGDAIRNITGETGPYTNWGPTVTPSGPFYTSITSALPGAPGSTNQNVDRMVRFDASRAVPTANENRPKTIKVLYCVKAFDAPTNQGLIDITELANEVAAKVNLADFIGANQSLTGNGWQKLPGGLILQWGNSVATWAALGSDALATITFNIAFNTVFAATTNPRDGTTVDTYGVNIHAISNTGMTVRYDDNRSASATQIWIAIGK